MLSISAKELLHLITGKINGYDSHESISIARWYLEDLHNLSGTDILSGKETEYEPDIIEEFCKRVNNFEPIQYILGQTEFYGIGLKVQPGVLIPRPETEELVDWIIKDHKTEEGLTILDIGTGSGCIPIALARNLKLAKINAFDISDEALSIAEKNAAENHCHIDFHKFDIASGNWQGKQFDIIVSNPPYIELSEKEMMRDNVLQFEPELALFTPENDPLFFYRSVLKFATLHLKKGGNVYFEINERFGKETTRLMMDFNFGDIILRKDINDKDRMIKGVWG